MEGIYLKDAANEKGIMEIMNMMNNIPGIKEIYHDKENRVLDSDYSMLILKDSLIIGFINLVVEKSDESFLFIDMGLKPEYRNQGIGKQVLRRIKRKLEEIDETRFVLYETKVNSKSGNGCINDVGYLLTEHEGKNIYLLQKERAPEFAYNGFYKELYDHLEKDNKKKKLFR